MEWFPCAMPALEAVLIIVTSVLSGTAYHYLAYGSIGSIAEFAVVGVLAAFLFVLLSSVRSPYRLEAFLENSRSLSSIANIWTSIFVALLLVGFITKTSDTLSRGWLILFYLLGVSLLFGFNYLAHRRISAAARLGQLQVRRLMVVGTSSMVEDFMERPTARQPGILIAAQTVLPDMAELDGMTDRRLYKLLQEDVERVRDMRITDVLVLLEPAYTDQLARIAAPLMDLPARLHLGGLDILTQFPSLQAEQIGQMRTIAIVQPPMSFSQRLLKRSIDVVLATAGLIVLSPVLLAVAIMIKLDSNGPALFRQRRRGYNQREFVIYKFRTMTTLDDGPNIRQAEVGDARITRIGALLRRANIDELPQLINVIRGDMALIGPRPHAVAHDLHYAPLIAQYARRLNVKPGISGWAQINGLRGPTKNEHDMRERVEHDLYYVEHWSLAFDLKILLMTVFSRRAYKNAF